MNRIKTIYLLIFLTIVLFGCGDGFLNLDVAFEDPIKGRKVNLSNKVGDSFQILRKTDTLNYTLSFDRSTDLNYLVKSATDTVFIGTVTKRNELFLLNRSLRNGKFAIHALKFTDSTITGLETEWIQSNMINNEINKGKYVHLITDTTNINTIKAKKKDGKQIFRFVIEQLTPEKRISYQTEPKTDNYKEEPVQEKLNLQTISKAKIITNVYPNPFIDNITIELTEEAPYVFKVFNINGKHIMTSKLKTDKMKLSLPNLKPGYYILKILSSDAATVDEIKLLKK